ncbi:MAG: TCP-1/cpn60 chaperonin family protein, partial [Clostridia bacterium]
DKEKLSERLASLCGGVAMISVGAATEVEMKEKKLRIEDALSATKAASLEGVVAGGGVALLKAQNDLKKFITTLDGDERLGAQTICLALTYPISQICENAGEDAAFVVKTISENASTTFGFDALHGKFVDMIKCGIIDPTKVTRSALENAASVASTLLTTEALIVEIAEKETENSSKLQNEEY